MLLVRNTPLSLDSDDNAVACTPAGILIYTPSLTVQNHVHSVCQKARNQALNRRNCKRACLSRFLERSEKRSALAPEELA